MHRNHVRLERSRNKYLCRHIRTRKELIWSSWISYNVVTHTLPQEYEIFLFWTYLWFNVTIKCLQAYLLRVFFHLKMVCDVAFNTSLVCFISHYGIVVNYVGWLVLLLGLEFTKCVIPCVCYIHYRNCNSAKN